MEVICSSPGHSNHRSLVCRRKQQRLKSATVKKSKPNPEFSTWMRTDQAIISWLMSSVSESMLGYVSWCVNSTQIWSTLQQLFAGSSKARLLQLRVQLQTLKKGSLSIIEFVMKVRVIVDNLAAAGQPVSEDELLLYVLGGLDSEYKFVVAILTARPDSVPLSEAQFILQFHETRLDQQNSLISLDLSHSSANFAKNRSRGRGSQHTRGRGSRENRGRGGRGNRPICTTTGHLASACWFRFDEKFQIQASSNSNQANTNQSSTAMLATQEVFDDLSWYIDSGATSHITSNLSNLDVSENYTCKDRLTVGNGLNNEAGSVNRGAQG